MLHTRPDAASVRLASYNIRKCVGLDWRRRPGRTLDVIAAIGADIIALQEADKRLAPRHSALPLDEIADRTGLAPVVLADNDTSLGWHGNAILARPGLAVRRTERIALPSLEPRGAVLAEFAHAAGPLRVIGTHLGLTRSHRKRQLTALAAHLAALPPMATVILGDFNEWSAQGGLAPLAPAFRIHAPGRSFHAARPLAALDRIAFCSNLSLRASGVSETALAVRASDHLPIWADLDFAG